MHLFINHARSAERTDALFTASHGVQQGTVISPLLLCMYIDDFVFNVKLLVIGLCYYVNMTQKLYMLR